MGVDPGRADPATTPADPRHDPVPQATVRVSYGARSETISVAAGSVLSDAIIATGLPFEQPCAGRGTCLKCKVMAAPLAAGLGPDADAGLPHSLSPLDDLERRGLTVAERAARYRLACRARVFGDVDVTLAPIVVYSNKIFRACNDHKRPDAPLGLAIDLGSTTVAAFVVTLDRNQVCAGGAGLNQQTAFGADVISRLAAAQIGPEVAERASVLALSSIVQAVDALHLSTNARKRIRKAVIVGNCAMHHLLLRASIDTLAELPFQPSERETRRFQSGAGASAGAEPFADIFPPGVEVLLPPLIGGFVGSDALACLLYYGFDRATEPMAAVDLGTNGEVMVTNGRRILVASTAAGPAFEGVNISCGSRAVDGAITGVDVFMPAGSAAGLLDSQAGEAASLRLRTVADQPPVGLTGSGLLELVYKLRLAGVIEPNGRLAAEHAVFGDRLSVDVQESPEGANAVRQFLIAESVDEEQRKPLQLTQHDIRELQKAKGAIRAAIDTLMAQLDLAPGDLARVILTGSFGSQLSIDAVVGLGMTPPVASRIIEMSPNGAGFGAAMMLDAEEFARAERIAAAAEQVDLDLDPEFDRRYVRSLRLTAD